MRTCVTPAASRRPSGLRADTCSDGPWVPHCPRGSSCLRGVRLLRHPRSGTGVANPAEAAERCNGSPEQTVRSAERDQQVPLTPRQQDLIAPILAGRLTPHDLADAETYEALCAAAKAGLLPVQAPVHS